MDDFPAPHIGATELGAMECDCGEAECEGPVFLHALCHPKAPPWSFYKDNALHYVCSECESPVVKIELGEVIT